jgi:hypothetical protein
MHHVIVKRFAAILVGLLILAAVLFAFVVT